MDAKVKTLKLFHQNLNLRPQTGHCASSPAATSSDDNEVMFMGEKPPSVAQLTLSNETPTTKRFNEFAQTFVQSDSKESNALSFVMHDNINPRFSRSD
jgi:hypothetical protein